jgi:putative sigma-54 modulation protein
MRIEIQASGLNLTTAETIAFREHARRRIQVAFERIQYRVTSVGVYLKDINGPRGGDDKRCVLRVEVSGAPTAVVRGRHGDLVALVDRLAQTAARSVLNRVKRGPDKATLRGMDDASINAPASPL